MERSHRPIARLRVWLLMLSMAATASFWLGSLRLSAYLKAVPSLHERRAALGALCGAIVLSSRAMPTEAFPNRVEPLKNEPKFPGQKPNNLGAIPRTESGTPDLAGCPDFPNCFSSAATNKNYLEPWRFSKGGTAKAFEDLQAAVDNYKPGQRGVDGGGFKVQDAQPERGYLYVQFESLKKGYKDDVEFLIRPNSSGEGGEVRVRSAIRQGQKDSGVNAKRLNGIAEQLAKLDGWSAPLLTNARFPEYVKLNTDENFGQSGPKMMNPREKSLFSVVKDVA